LSDDSPLVRAMAVWALSKLLQRHAFAVLAEQYAIAETDCDVAAEWKIPLANGE
jgi:epoxyqueuosine reductase